MLTGSKYAVHHARIKKVLSLVKINDVNEAQTNIAALLRAFEKAAGGKK